jgi:hypothetical protein
MYNIVLFMNNTKDMGSCAGYHFLGNFMSFYVILCITLYIKCHASSLVMSFYVQYYTYYATRMSFYEQHVYASYIWVCCEMRCCETC